MNQPFDPRTWDGERDLTPDEASLFYDYLVNEGLRTQYEQGRVPPDPASEQPFDRDAAERASREEIERFWRDM